MTVHRVFTVPVRMWSHQKLKRIVAVSATLSLAFAGAAFAAEGGAGFYLLGSRGPAAGALPPPGIYFQNDIYIYSGSLGGGRGLPTGGKVVGDVDGSVAVELPTGIWVTPWEILGGNFGLSATVPVGYKSASAKLDIVSPRFGTAIQRGQSDDIFTVGDPVISGMIGWHHGNFHWQTGVMVNVPIGDYHDGALANLSFNHWGADVYAAASWIDPTSGIDISGAIGVTFNAENPATNYRTGDELHIEWAVSKTFSPKFSAGLTGYYYDQISGDSGAGAVLGGFEGRVAAIGATVGYNFEVGETPVAARLKYFHEFAADNRAEGDAGYITFSIPIGQHKPKTQLAASE